MAIKSKVDGHRVKLTVIWDPRTLATFDLIALNVIWGSFSELASKLAWNLKTVVVLKAKQSDNWDLETLIALIWDTIHLVVSKFGISL